MEEISPPVRLDDPANEPSKQYLLLVGDAKDPDFDYPQVGAHGIFLRCVCVFSLAQFRYDAIFGRSL